MQTGSLNVDHEYQEPTKELNNLLLNTLEATINAFGTIGSMTEKRWLRILRRQVDEKSIWILSDGGSNDWPLERELFGIVPSFDLFNTRTLLIWHLIPLVEILGFAIIVCN